MEKTDFDVLIVGAGLSGIGAAVHLGKKCPGKSYVILEMREASGGTWDLFRYPGIRSDSDMHTLGYNFKPWDAQKAIADGPAILKYVRETAKDYGVEEHIRYNRKVVSANWDSQAANWQVEVEGPDGPETYTARWLHMCSGYYRYDQGYMPEFAGQDAFKGDLIHPQHWPEDLDYADKNVVIIGSGATAMTLVPAMTDKAAHVTMLQRSPTYVVSRPAEDGVANFMRKIMPNKMAYGITRWKNVLMQLFFYNMTRVRPKKVKERLIGMVEEELGPDFDVEKHFTPTYNPWDQRLCLVPDSDLFAALKDRRASVVTDHIDRFLENGIQLKSGDVLDADIIVSATGLELIWLGGMQVSVDGQVQVPHDLLNYRGAMVSNVPNMTSVFGYTNASWTLRADLTSEYMCKVLRHMDKKGYVEARPVADGVEAADDFLDFSSGYVQRAMDRFPRRAKEAPWLMTQNYARDIFLMRHGKVEDGALQFRKANEPVIGLSTEPLAVAAE
ncbi:NAD(P)/FAD-dependent oxidoreductase [Hyphomonas sp. FCG-A18]|uniref:flavin-containing monooxygenase n=1 Tax=Hyphomonas sp. FCG-A18 TaxID=3080019 RepID=UPI002B31E278|nr:NAD(P)/FAD-dependent oxidoreductase [Hyphomonas sp. FCG-A18]